MTDGHTYVRTKLVVKSLSRLKNIFLKILKRPFFVMARVSMCYSSIISSWSGEYEWVVYDDTGYTGQHEVL